MRIAHMTATFPPYLAGTGNVCYHNARELARRGHDVHVFTVRTPVTLAHELRDGVTVHRLRPLAQVGNAALLPGLPGIDAFDVVHLHYPFFFGSEAILLKSLVTRLPYVVTYHQDVVFQGLLRCLETIHHWLLGRNTLTHAAMVLATSWDYAKFSRLRAVLQQRSVPVAELPNGVDPQRFHPSVNGDGLRAKYGLMDGQRVILFVGALDRPHFFKGVDVLLEAVARLPDRGTRLLIVGDGNLRPGYQEAARRLGLAERVVFAGRVPDADLPPHYAIADFLVLPSTTMGEAFGLVLLEAMASGKPVIASNLPGVRSVVSDREDGLLVQPGDAGGLREKVQALLDDPERQRVMGARARAKVEERYSWERIVVRLEEIYRQVLEKPGVSRNPAIQRE